MITALRYFAPAFAGGSASCNPPDSRFLKTGQDAGCEEGSCKKIAERQQGGNSPLKNGVAPKAWGVVIQGSQRKAKMLMVLGIERPLMFSLPVRQPPEGYATAVAAPSLPMIRGNFFTAPGPLGLGRSKCKEGCT